MSETKAFWVECRGHDGFLTFGVSHGRVRARTRMKAAEMGYRLAFGDIHVTRRPDQDKTSIHQIALLVSSGFPL